MVSLELTPEEQEVLTETLEHEVFDLRDEITHTDATDFKEKLRTRKKVLEELLTRVRDEHVTA